MPRRPGRLLPPLLLLLSLQQFGAAALIEVKAWLAPVLVARAWQQTLANGGDRVKPWPWADTWPVARLDVPALGVTRFVLAGTSGQALAFGPGHDEASAAPGTQGAAVIGGHRDTHFAFLQQLRGDMSLQLELPDRRRRLYRLARTSVVDSTDGHLPALDAGEQLLLITCYPFEAIDSGGPLRFVAQLAPAGELLAELSPARALHTGDQTVIGEGQNRMDLL